MVDHNNVEVSNLSHNVMRALNPTVLVTSVTEPLTWDNAMELVRGDDCVVDARDNPRTRYLINGACVLAGREPKSTAMTNGVRVRGGGPIPLVSGSAMGTERQLMEYNHWGRGGVRTKEE